MNIIPQDWGFVQVSFSPKGEFDTNSYQIPTNLNQIITSTVTQAHRLYDLGLNVFPQPIAEKSGYAWKRLQYTRTHRDSVAWGLSKIMNSRCNLAVMCGSTSNNLFIIDCETPTALSTHMDHLRARHIPLWVVQTARGGHIYLLSKTGEVHNVASGVLDDAEVRGRNAYVLAPPSIHPTGVRYEWLIREGDTLPLVDVRDINWLTAKDGTPVTLQTTKSTFATTPSAQLRVLSPYSNLSKATRDYIQNGHALVEGVRNTRLFNAACDMSGNQYSLDEARAILMTVALGSQLSSVEIERTVESAYSRPRQPARSTAKAIVVKGELWKYAMIYVTQREWAGRSANNEKALWLAMVERARLSANERGVFRASIRELATLARMGINTVQRILDRFLAEKVPVLFKVGQDQLSGATLWRFSDIVLEKGKRVAMRNEGYSLPVYWMSYTDALIHCDAVERGGIGKGAMYLYQFMKAHKTVSMPSQLAKVSHMSVNQVNYALLKLREFDLVKRVREGWCIIELSIPEINDIVTKKKPQLAGKGQARYQKFVKERQIFVSRILYNARLKREGVAFASALSHQVPRMLRTDEIDEDVRDVLASEISWMLFEEGGICHLEDGRVLSYHKFND